MDKKELRAQIKKKAGSLSPEYISCASESISEKLFSLHEFSAAKKLFIYLSADKEPRTDKIIREALRLNKEVFVPVCKEGEMRAVSLSGTRLSVNRFGIREPLSWTKEALPCEIDFTVVPCVAASKDKKRLGHGGGYYDRFLSLFDGFSACLCFEELLCGDIPTLSHDISPDCIITEKEIFI